MKKLLNKLYPGALPLLLVVFAGVEIKLEKVDPTFQVSIHVHPYHPLQQTTENNFNNYRCSLKSQNSNNSFGTQLFGCGKKDIVNSVNERNSRSAASYLRVIAPYC